MNAIFRKQWRNYVQEGAGLMAFMIGAGTSATVFQASASPLRRAIPSDLIRDLCMGGAVAMVTAAIVYSPWGKKTGAMINPAVTLAFHRLGRIGRWDAAFYILFQFSAAMLATPLLLSTIGAPFADPRVRFGTTQPGPLGSSVAFAAEFAMSFVLMLIILMATGSRRWKPFAGIFVAAAIGLFIAFESPLSGMSLNPARSFGAALTAGQWHGLWIYFVAPVVAMLLAAEMYRWLQLSGHVEADRLPFYPIEQGLSHV